MAELQKYTIRSNNGLVAELTNYGARLMSLFVPQENGNKLNVCLGFKILKIIFLLMKNILGQ